MFKNHLEMIGRNESPSKKAKFWQSYTSVPRASSPVARDSYLSPVKNRYLWSKHPARPLTPHRSIL
uniref:Mf1 protein n=1 Tax=Drosophila melanogaster TaxID=7227 RepID=Q70VI4_DROME|nr:Mf1 protein [Drosophila melanogaster]